MTEVDYETYQHIVTRVRCAANYAGIGRHQVDGTSHYITQDGQRILVAEEFEDDFSNEIHFRVHPSLNPKTVIRV